MHTRWLNAILRLTNLVYLRQQRVLARTGIRTVWDTFVLAVLEVALAVVSLPLYLMLRSARATALLAERGYAEITTHYRVRRVLTLTGVGVVLGIWILKLAIATVAVVGPVEPYAISDLRPADLGTELALLHTAEAETARVDPTLAVPRIIGVTHERNGSVAFTGTGTPGLTIVLLVSSTSAFVFSDTVRGDGTWRIADPREGIILEPGTHEFAAYQYDPDARVRSAFSPSQYVRITRGWQERMLANIDRITNVAIITIVLIGVFLTILTISIEDRGAVPRVPGAPV